MMERKRERLSWLVACVLAAGGVWYAARCAPAADGDAGDWTGVAWIGEGKAQPGTAAACYEDDPAPLFRKRFTVTKPIRGARLQVVGLGLYAAWINAKALNRGLDPLWTPYAKRVLYDTYDVTQSLQVGENVLAVELGNGWYNPLPMRLFGWLNLREALTVGRPCLIAKLAIEYADGSAESLASDISWKVCDGPLLRNNLYLGEVFDARRDPPGWRQVGYADSTWRAATLVTGPPGILQPRRAPGIVERKGWPANHLSEPKPGVYVADLGRNFAGQARFHLGAGDAGQRLTFRYGELLNKDGTVNGLTAVCGQIKRAGMAGAGAPAMAEACDVFVRNGSGDEIYQPKFTWHGFRYVQVEGLTRPLAKDDVWALPLAAAVADASEFSCSSPLLNDLHRACRNTFLSNLMGVQSDCPARERFGYGADIAATTEALIFNFDMHALYAKSIQDFADEAAGDGWFTETAPYVGIATSGFGGRSGPIGWTLGVPVMMRDLYRYYGDRAIIERHYDACAKYLDLVRGKCPDLIVAQCIGDHEALEKAPATLTATAHFHQWARLVAGFATILGKPADAQKFSALADDIRAAFQHKFVVGGKVGGGSQGEQVFGLYHRLIPESDRAAALEILGTDIEAKGGALTTGIFATKYLLEVLSTEGRSNLAGRLVARRDFPSWGYMLDHGATTLWENWAGSDNTYSQNHPMFGSLDEWCMKHALGIAVADDACGCDQVVIRPAPVVGLTWAKGEYRSIKGPVKVAWRLSQGKVKLSIEVPAGMQAKVWLDDKQQYVTVGVGMHQW